jgi:glyoxylase I family protein
MKPLGVHHVSLNVSDVERVASFYTDVLGGVRRQDRPDLGFPGCWIDVGAQQVHLLEGSTPEAFGQHFAIRVEDLHEVVRELRGRGIEVGEPTTIGAGLQSFLLDPSGNLVELHQPG